MESSRSENNLLSVGDTVQKVVTVLSEIVSDVKSLFFLYYHRRIGRAAQLKKWGDSSLQMLLDKVGLEDQHNGTFVDPDMLIASWLMRNRSQLFAEMCLHSDLEAKSTIFEISTPVTLEFIEEKIQLLPNGNFLAIRSLLRMSNDRILYIPMLDFKPPTNLKNMELIKNTLRQLDLNRGVIMESSHSYHFIGFEVFDFDKWLNFMGRCCLLSPLVDTRYVGHSLLHRASDLRISAGFNKPRVPTVVTFL